MADDDRPFLLGPAVHVDGPPAVEFEQSRLLRRVHRVEVLAGAPQELLHVGVVDSRHTTRVLVEQVLQ